MGFKRRVFISSFALAVIAGCASTEIADREVLATEQLPRPDRI